LFTKVYEKYCEITTFCNESINNLLEKRERKKNKKNKQNEHA